MNTETVSGSSFVDVSFSDASIESAYRRCKIEQRKGHRAFAEKGLRAVRAHDRRVLKALERAAEALHRASESQFGRTSRDAGSTFAERVWPSEAQLWRTAYECADRGDESTHPLIPFMYIFGAAAELAGY